MPTGSTGRSKSESGQTESWLVLCELEIFESLPSSKRIVVLTFEGFTGQSRPWWVSHTQFLTHINLKHVRLGVRMKKFEWRHSSPVFTLKVLTRLVWNSEILKLPSFENAYLDDDRARESLSLEMRTCRPPDRIEYSGQIRVESVPPLATTLAFSPIPLTERNPRGDQHSSRSLANVADFRCQQKVKSFN